VRDLNFFKPYLGKKKEKINSNIYIYGSAAIVGILIIGSLLFNTTRMYLLDKSINDYKSKLAASEIQEKLKEAENVNKETSTLKQYDTSLNGIAVSIKKRDNVSDSLLKDISSTLPSKVSFKSLDIVENTIAIKGTSTGRTPIAELEHNLNELPIIENVYVNSIDAQGSTEGEYSFDIKCVLKDVE
jgi:type IV pilus assembly protein PilN